MARDGPLSAAPIGAGAFSMASQARAVAVLVLAKVVWCVGVALWAVCFGPALSAAGGGSTSESFAEYAPPRGYDLAVC